MVLEFASVLNYDEEQESFRHAVTVSKGAFADDPDFAPSLSVTLSVSLVSPVDRRWLHIATGGAAWRGCIIKKLV